MKASEFCNREVVVVDKDTSVGDAAALMRRHHVGCVVVVESMNGTRRPVGILTDRDIVLEFVTQHLSPADVAVGDAVRHEIVTMDENTEFFEAIEIMRRRGVNRIPVVDDKGSLIGLFASDDALELLRELVTDLSAIALKQQRREQQELA
ncbi:MAG: CBS domain-containing protein [Gammaproteobacteria bacterium]|nr:CBS domain-containing protein [Gammaproteobacteria bacterium]